MSLTLVKSRPAQKLSLVKEASIPQPFVVEGVTPVWSIGPTMRIRGELQAEIDVSIEGRFEGKIVLPDNRLFTGACSRIHGDITARSVTLRGDVEGNITALDRVTLTPTAKVRGDIRAPRVTLAPGCVFNGRIIKERDH